MKPIPVVFHLGPLQIHTYGIGLAITFAFAFAYYARRLRDHGYPTEWWSDALLWIVGMALLGARTFHVLANLSFYTGHPIEIPQVWHGGLSSFGGLAFGIPTGLLITRRRCPQLPLAIAGDLIAPVLVVAWAVGRLLGPQLMIAGGGRQTTAWYGMYYAGEVGKRIPVPLLQAAECLVIYFILLRLERLLVHRGSRPIGFLTAAAVTLWDASRISDEHFFLAQPGHVGSLAVQLGATALTVLGAVAMVVLWVRDRHRSPVDPPEEVGESRSLLGELR
ncbi:MAG: prolipoprotein diacylglyceryl transferase [Mycobacteriales bacterium]